MFTQHIIWLSDNLSALIFTAVTLWWTLLSIKWVQTFFQNEVQFYQHHILNMYIYMYIAIFTNQINNGAKHNSVFNIMLNISHTSMTILGFDVETIFKQEAHASHRSPEQITLVNFQKRWENWNLDWSENDLELILHILFEWP